MNKKEFIELSIHPNKISENHVVGLEFIVEEFPYFQTAQILHLKALKEQGSFKYNNFLKKVAAYTTNRTVLFDFITTDHLNFEESVQIKEDNLLNLEVFSSEIIQVSEVTPEQQKETNDNLFPEEFQVQNLLQVEKDLAIGKPIAFNKKEDFPFKKWLDIVPPKKIEREIAPKKEVSTLSKQVDLIEQFILKKPKIKPTKGQVNKDIAMDSVVENTNLMTETLAQVYLEQKKYDKAITAFRILSLKYPEKSSFFAERINAIKFLQKNKS